VIPTFCVGSPNSSRRTIGNALIRAGVSDFQRAILNKARAYAASHPLPDAVMALLTPQTSLHGRTRLPGPVAPAIPTRPFYLALCERMRLNAVAVPRQCPRGCRTRHVHTETANKAIHRLMDRSLLRWVEKKKAQA